MKPANNSIQKKLYQVIDESLALLKQSSISEQKPAALDVPIPSLLEQCLELCEQHQEQSQEPLRTIHHFGLPLDSPLLSSLATIPNTRVLTDIHPNNNSFKDTIKNQTLVARSINSNNQTESNSEDEYRIKVFLNDLQQIQKESNQIGQRLIICDNHCLSQTDKTQSPDLLTLLNRQFTVRSLIVVTDPVDSYPVYCAAQSGMPHFSFEEYCQSMFAFMEANSDLIVIRREGFAADPERMMREMCEKLALPFCKEFLTLKEAFVKKQGKSSPSFIDFYVHQTKEYRLGNFVMCTPTIKTLYDFYKTPVPVVFSTEYLKEIYKNWNKIEIINQDQVKKRKLTKLFGTNLINMEIEDYKFIHQTICDKKEIQFTSTPLTYAPKLKSTDNSDYAVIIKGCFPNSAWEEKKHIPDIHYKKAIDKIKMKIKFIGSIADYNDYLKPLVEHSKHEHKVEVILESVDQILREINGAKIVITNDTGWYHVAGALNKKMFCFWKDTPFRKNLVPGNNCTYSHKNFWDKDFENWIEGLG